MELTIYPDQNVLIYFYEESRKSLLFEKTLIEAITDNRLTIVLSPWHWVETAQTQNLEKLYRWPSSWTVFNPIGSVTGDSIRSLPEYAEIRSIGMSCQNSFLAERAKMQ